MKRSEMKRFLASLICLYETNSSLGILFKSALSPRNICYVYNF